MKIIIVCIGNYCRSPVAEYILKSKLPANFSISSAGISPYLGMNNMDRRSARYLKQKNISSGIHVPRKLTEIDVRENDLILALDLKVLNNILKRYNKYMYKTKLFTYKNNAIEIKDPFKLMNHHEYSTEMEKIYETSNIIVEHLMKN